FYKETVANGALSVQHCSDCGSWTHPARYFCPKCFSGKFSFDKVSGRATVYSYTVSHFTVEAAWKPLLPYVTIVAELEEGPRLVAYSKDITPEKVKIGLSIRVTSE